MATIIVASTVLIILNPFKSDENGDDDSVRVLYLSIATISDDVDFKIVDQNGKAWIEKQDVKNVYVSLEDEKGRYLEFALTDDGADRFYKATQDENRILSVQINGVNMISPIIQDSITESSAIYVGKYEDLMKCYRAIAVPIYENAEELANTSDTK